MLCTVYSQQEKLYANIVLDNVSVYSKHTCVHSTCHYTQGTTSYITYSDAAAVSVSACLYIQRSLGQLSQPGKQTRKLFHVL